MGFSADLFRKYWRRPDRDGLVRLLEHHRESVRRLCFTVLQHSQDAEDASQEVLLKVARQGTTIKDPERFAGWLYQTALRTALDAKKKRERRERHDAEFRRASSARESLPDPC